jgi:hypothetical protein
MLESHTYPTLLCGKAVTFSRSDSPGRADAPEWSRVLLDGDIRIIGMKEVSSHSPPFVIAVHD